jgi:hypothetical protein
MTSPPPPGPAPAVRTAHSHFQLSTGLLQTPSHPADPDRLAKGRPPEVGGGLSFGVWGGSEAFVWPVLEGQKMPRRRANLPQMRTQRPVLLFVVAGARALTVGRPAGGNHMRPGAADLSLRSLAAACGPRAHVMRLRPGRPTVRTLKAHLYCADALSGFGRDENPSLATGLGLSGGSR